MVVGPLTISLDRNEYLDDYLNIDHKQCGVYMIALDHVYKSYNNGAVQAVSDLSLIVPEGEIFGFLGPNGAGKSTTINMMIGLLRPDRGSIVMDGLQAGKDLLQIKRKIGYVADEPVFYEKMTGLQFIRFISDIFEVTPEDQVRRTAELAERFEITDALGDVSSSYSHGMKQKLAIISALVHDPDIFILDEPMVGLDPRAAFTLKEIMRELCDAGKTVFFSTHVMDVAERLCDRVGIIRKGRLVACDTFENLRGASEATLEEVFLELTDEAADTAH